MEAVNRVGSNGIVRVPSTCVLGEGSGVSRLGISSTVTFQIPQQPATPPAHRTRASFGTPLALILRGRIGTSNQREQNLPGGRAVLRRSSRDQGRNYAAIHGRRAFGHPVCREKRKPSALYRAAACAGKSRIPL